VSDRSSSVPVGSPWRRRGRWLLLPLVFLFINLFGAAPNDGDMVLQIMDEGGFVEVGEKALRLALVEHDFRNPFWADPYWNYGANNPRLGVFIVGAVGQFAGLITPDKEKKKFVMRLVMSLLSTAVVALLFALTVRLTASRPAAYAAAALLLWHPAFRLVARSMLTEIPLLLFCLLTLHGAWWIKTDRQRPQRATPWILTGLAAGCAISTKLFAVGLLPLLLLLIGRRIWLLGRAAVYPALLLLASIVVVFVLSNPLLWTDPVYGVEMMTVLHVRSNDGYVTWPEWGRMKPLFFQTFDFFSWRFDAARIGIPPPESFPWWRAAPGFALTVAGLAVRNAGRDKWMILTTFVGFLAIYAYVAGIMSADWYRLKLALLPAVGAIALCSYLVCRLVPAKE